MSPNRHNILIFVVILVFCDKLYAFSSHWNRVLPRICSDTTPDKVYNGLIGCDQTMDSEVVFICRPIVSIYCPLKAKEIFDDCVFEVTGTEVSDEKPRICYYQGKSQQLDSCKSSRYKEKNYGVKQIISKELKHMWCLMKVARPLGWEHLCVSNLPPAKKSAVRRCDDAFREITNPIYQCYSQLFGQNDGRPIACRSFENTIQLWGCLERKAKQRNNRNKASELESKANRYMDCLKNI